jgi:hypothetical protein
MLRNAIAEAQNRGKIPTVVVSPNDAVTSQWRDTFIKAGVPKSRIVHFKANGPKQKFCGATYILLDRYKLQTELNGLFTKASSLSSLCFTSPLFPNVSRELLLGLKNQYL